MAENRTKLRARATTLGSAVIGTSAEEVACIVLDHSSTGACLTFRSSVSVPTSFALRIGRERRAHPVEVKWRKADRIGVAFLEPRDVPDVMQI